MASGWEKAVVEKSVHDSRRRIWQEAAKECFVQGLNGKACHKKTSMAGSLLGLFDFYVTSKTITATIRIKNMIAGIMLLVNAGFCASNWSMLMIVSP